MEVEVSSYTVEEVLYGSLKAHVIRNTKTDEYVQIVTDFGGKVEALRLMSRSTGALRDVLLTDNANETAITENKFWKGMLLVPWANRIAYGKYSFNGNTHQLPLNDPPRQNSLHGFLAGKKFSVYTTSTTATCGKLTLSYDFDGSDEGYPFTLRMLVSYELSQSGFSVSLTITNTMPQAPLPLTVGWHPYFACSTHQARVQFEPRTAWNLVELDANMDPTGNTQLDTIFDGSQAIGGTAVDPTFYDSEFKPRSPVSGVMLFRITDVPSEQSVVLWQDDSFRLTHIFTGAMKCFGQNGIALEPMSGMADGFNNHDHLTILSAGETWTGAFGVYVE